MHVRPVFVLAIVAAAAGASIARFAGGTASRAPSIATPTPRAAAVPSGARDADVAASQRFTSADTSDATTSRDASRTDAAGTASVLGGSRVLPRARLQLVDSTSPHPRAVVYVAGDVRRPGVYALGADARVADALRAAGGATADADPVAVDLAAHVEDGEEIAVPARGSADAASVPVGADATAAPRKRKHSRRHRRRGHAHRKTSTAVHEDGSGDLDAGTAGPIATVDLNAADAATLATLPGIGAGLAERIVAFRALNGPFASTDELLDVGGVSASKADRLAPFVTFGKPAAP